MDGLDMYEKVASFGKASAASTLQAEVRFPVRELEGTMLYLEMRS